MADQGPVGDASEPVVRELVPTAKVGEDDRDATANGINTVHERFLRHEQDIEIGVYSGTERLDVSTKEVHLGSGTVRVLELHGL